MRRFFLPAAVAATFAAAQPASAAVNLITNGDFNVPGTFSGEYITLRDNNSPAGFGWSITGTVDVFRTDGRLGGEPDPTGGDPNALDLVGTGYEGGIHQFFATEVGRTYRLTFDFANNPFAGAAAMDVAFLSGGVTRFTQSVTHSDSAVNDMRWQTQVFEFTAVDDRTFLSFQNTDGGFSGGMYLDNISVFDVTAPGAVPEPSAWALMISGFGLAGTALRRRRLAGAAA